MRRFAASPPSAETQAIVTELRATLDMTQGPIAENLLIEQSRVKHLEVLLPELQVAYPFWHLST